MRRPKQKREKSVVVGMELKIHPGMVMVYVRRRWPGDDFRWKVHQRVTPSSVRRIARVAESLVRAYE